jgi:hypothetical protein
MMTVSRSGEVRLCGIVSVHSALAHPENISVGVPRGCSLAGLSVGGVCKYKQNRSSAAPRAHRHSTRRGRFVVTYAGLSTPLTRPRLVRRKETESRQSLPSTAPPRAWPVPRSSCSSGSGALGGVACSSVGGEPHLPIPRRAVPSGAALFVCAARLLPCARAVDGMDVGGGLVC